MAVGCGGDDPIADVGDAVRHHDLVGAGGKAAHRRRHDVDLLIRRIDADDRKGDRALRPGADADVDEQLPLVRGDVCRIADDGLEVDRTRVA